MSDTVRKDYENKQVRDGESTIELKNKKNQKKSTKKFRKLEAKDDWATSNLNKCDKLERLIKGEEYES